MTPLGEIIARQIGQTGPITVADYMQQCLFHPTLGYYTTHEPFGAQGDFVTAPEISQMFGELLGLWAADTWMRLGSLPLRAGRARPRPRHHDGRHAAGDAHRAGLARSRAASCWSRPRHG